MDRFERMERTPTDYELWFRGAGLVFLEMLAGIAEGREKEAGDFAGLPFILWNRETYWRFLAALRPAFFRPFFAAFFPPLRPFFAAMMISP